MSRSRKEFLRVIISAVENVSGGNGEVKTELAWICLAAPKLFAGRSQEEMEGTLRRRAGQIAKITIPEEVDDFWNTERGIRTLHRLQDRLADLPKRRQKTNQGS